MHYVSETGTRTVSSQDQKKNDPKCFFYPEAAIDGFATVNGDIAFYSLVRAICLKFEKKPRLLDFGAGRATWFENPASDYTRFLRHLNAETAYVVAADVDPVVKTNRASSEQVVLEPNASLSFPDRSFDIIVADWTFEHLEQPDEIAKEFDRILRPGGWICARTPNRFGYVALISSILPNETHTYLLKIIQPSRIKEDIFPTFYRMNTIKKIKKVFKECDVIGIKRNFLPAYHFNSKLVFAFGLCVHWLMPNFFAHNIMVFMKKRGSRE